MNTYEELVQCAAVIIQLSDIIVPLQSTSSEECMVTSARVASLTPIMEGKVNKCLLSCQCLTDIHTERNPKELYKNTFNFNLSVSDIQ